MFSDNSWDIELRTSNNCILASNTCTRSYVGIALYMSNNNTLENNNCSSVGSGIRLELSSGNELRNNSCELNAGFSILLIASGNNGLKSNSCNSNNWSGIEVGPHSDDNILANNTCEGYSRAAMILARSSKNMLVNNACPNNCYGILIDVESVENEVTRNAVSRSTLYSVSVVSGAPGNRIWNNTFIGSSSNDLNRIQAQDGGTNNWWNSTDGWGNYWSDWFSPDVDMNGIVDSPFVLISATGAVRDYYPLTAPVYTQEPVTQVLMSGTMGTNQWYLSPVRLVFVAYETVSGVNWTKFSIDGGPWLLCVNPVTIAAEGEHEVGYYSQDYSGETEAVQTVILKIDTTAPTTQAYLSGNQSLNQWYVSPG